MNWYVHTPEGEAGPYPFETLAAWAKDSQLLANHPVRADEAGADWVAAGDLPELGLFWRVHFPDGSVSLPVHADVIAQGLESGEFQPDNTVEDARTGEPYQLVDVVCAALMEQNRVLREAVAAAVPTHEVPPVGAAPSSPTEWQNLARELDFYKKECAKLRKFMEDEQTRSRQREEQLTGMTERFRANERDYAERLAMLNQTRERMEAEMRAMRETLRTGNTDSQVVSLGELAMANQEMSRELAHLQEQMVDHERRLQAVSQEREDVERDARERVLKLEEQLVRERQEARKAHDQTLRIEHKHREMLAAYRELSDRLIHMRNEALRIAARPEDAPDAPGASAARTGADGPRVRLR